MRKVAVTIRQRAGEFASALRRHRNYTDVEFGHRERLTPGDRVHFEVSFGPMADEVNVYGEVQQILDDSPRDRKIVVRLDPDFEDQLRYIEEVLGGGREAAARRHRRLPSSLSVRWDDGRATVTTHLLDISAGGAFIVSEELPRVGETVSVQLRTGDILNPLRINSVVSWVRTAQNETHRGFGVSFKVSNPAAASRLNRVVRDHEQAFAGHEAR